MIFSKSFAYAIRSIIYLAEQHADKSRVQLDEIAGALNIPRYFLGKVMNRLVKEGIIDSVKGHKGGFSMNETTLSTRLSGIARLTGDGFQSNQCVLHLGTCNAERPCPFHQQIEPLQRQWNTFLQTITVKDLLTADPAVSKEIRGIYQLP